MVVHEEIVRLLLPEFLERISPQDIAHQPVGWRLSEAVNLAQVSSGSPNNLEILTLLRSSNVWSSGLRPPCIHRNCLFIIAANGSAQNDSMQASYTVSEYLCLHSSLKVK
jgi:hypothetical protein